MDNTFEHISFSDMFEIGFPKPYTHTQQEILDVIKADVKEHFADHPRRLVHIEGVAKSAYALACIYHADPFICECAGYLHDWDKYLSEDELVKQAEDLGIDMGVDLCLVLPLLHGRITAVKLKEKYPELDKSVFDAIDAHTTGEMTPTLESRVVYIADLIEPSRPDYDSIQSIRSMVGQVDLETLYLEAYRSTISYLKNTDKFIWPRSIEILNYLTSKN